MKNIHHTYHQVAQSDQANLSRPAANPDPLQGDIDCGTSHACTYHEIQIEEVPKLVPLQWYVQQFGSWISALQDVQKVQVGDLG